MRFLTGGAVMLFILSAFSAPGWSAGKKPGGLYNKPVYNAETKSYFELYSPDANNPKHKGHVRDFGGIKWFDANKIAYNRWHKGVRGRLAVVKSLAVHRFLKKTFKPTGPAWIGLRYWCKYGKLQWVTGDIHEFSAFKAWSPIWNISGGSPINPKKRANCRQGSIGYMPVHYWSYRNGFQWNANGTDKDFNQLFIEYSTGKE